MKVVNEMGGTRLGRGSFAKATVIILNQSQMGGGADTDLNRESVFQYTACQSVG